MRIALVGPYPPPYGGISVHLQRLAKKLEEDCIEVTIFKNTTVRHWIIKNIIQFKRYDLIHFHDIYWLDRFIIGILSLLGINTVLTIHGDSLLSQLHTLTPIQRSLLVYGLRRIKHIIGVKPEIQELLTSIGVKPEHISIITAYLSPKVNFGDYNKLPLEVRRFIDEHNPVIMQSAFQIIPFAEHDLYGVEMTVDLCSVMIEECQNIGFLIFLAEIGDRAHLQRLLLRIRNEQLEGHILFVYGQQLTPALIKANLFVRPTYSDGYSVSVAEAIELGVPTIASNVCIRPVGTTIFSAGDLDDFFVKVVEVLSKLTHNNDIKLSETTAYRDLLRVYKSILRK